MRIWKILSSFGAGWQERAESADKPKIAHRNKDMAILSVLLGAVTKLSGCLHLSYSKHYFSACSFCRKLHFLQALQ